MSEVSSSIFGSSNVLDKDESYTYVTDIEVIDATTLRNAEHQKLISKTHWKLDNNETISYSFLGPGSSYDNTQSDIKEFSGLIAVTDAFKAATKSAFDLYLPLPILLLRKYQKQEMLLEISELE